MRHGGRAPDSQASGDDSGETARKSSSALLLECRKKFLEVDEEARGLRTILSLSEEIIGELDLDKLLARAMTGVVKLTGAERGYVVLVGRDGGLAVRSSYKFDARDGDDRGVAFSQTVVRRAIESGEPILSTNATEDDRFSEARSVRMVGLRAVMAAPIPGVDRKPIGAVYLDDPLHAGQFSKRSLRLLEGFAAQVAIAIRTAQHHDALVQEREQRRMLAIARDVQQNLMPRGSLDAPGLRASWRYYPAFAIGGDIVQFLEFADGGRGVLVADVAGKGVPAALIVSRLHQAARLLARQTEDPLDFFASVNEAICEDLPARTMVTAALVVCSSDPSRVRYVRAGHCPLLQLRPGKKSAEWLTPPGVPMGLFGRDWLGMDTALVEIELDPGDGLVLYTDGVTEAFDEAKDIYGEDRLLAFAREHTDCDPEEFAEGLLKDLRAFTGDALQSDDITLACVRRVP